jgi:uncharacterized protein (TIRG00374 family)
LGRKTSGRSRKLILILVNVLSLAVSYWTLRDVHWYEIRDRLATMDWSWVTVAIVSNLLVYVWQAWRWMLLVRPVARINLGHTTRAIYVGLFANEVLPLRAGELLRGYLLGRWTELPFSVALSSALIERVFDGLWLSSCLLMVLQMVRLPGRLRYVEGGGYALAFIVLGVGLMLSIGLFRRKKAQYPAGLTGWRRRWAVLMEDLSIMGHSRYLLFSFLLSLPFLLIQVVPIWAAARGYGIDLSLSGAFVVMVLLRLGTTIPSAPGNLGFYQFLTREALQRIYHVPAAQAAPFSWVLWVIVSIPLLVMGFAAMLVTESKLSELHLAAQQEANTNSAAKREELLRLE